MWTADYEFKIIYCRHLHIMNAWKLLHQVFCLDSYYGLNDHRSPIWPPSCSSLSMQSLSVDILWNYLLSKWLTWCYPKLIHWQIMPFVLRITGHEFSYTMYYKCASNSIILRNWIPASPSPFLEKSRRGVRWPNFLTRMRWSVKARASAIRAHWLASYQPLAGGSISCAAAHCYGWLLMQRLALPLMRGTK